MFPAELNSVPSRLFSAVCQAELLQLACSLAQLESFNVKLPASFKFNSFSRATSLDQRSLLENCSKEETRRAEDNFFGLTVLSVPLTPPLFLDATIWPRTVKDSSSNDPQSASSEVAAASIP
uniref:Uncharacterized protein n=1 Tax=Arundo donax TaxID=35708 RepID=A0A0A9E1H9_ARUDO